MVPPKLQVWQTASILVLDKSFLIKQYSQLQSFQQKRAYIKECRIDLISQCVVINNDKNPLLTEKMRQGENETECGGHYYSTRLRYTKVFPKKEFSLLYLCPKKMYRLRIEKAVQVKSFKASLFSTCRNDIKLTNIKPLQRIKL